jgi:Holliday junction resolvase
MPLNSRAKGASGERELVDELNRLGLMARRSVQYCGKSGEASDVLIEGCSLHVEVKRVERVRLGDWIDQASRDAHGRAWGVFTRQNRGQWMVIVPLTQWIEDSVTARQAIAHVDRIRSEAIRAQTGVQPLDAV